MAVTGVGNVAPCCHGRDGAGNGDIHAGVIACPFGKIDGAFDDGFVTVPVTHRLEHVRRCAKRVGDDDLCPCPNVILMSADDGIGVLNQGGAAPGLRMHGHATAFQFGPHGTVNDQHFTVVEFVFPLGHQATSFMVGMASRSAAMWSGPRPQQPPRIVTP